MLILVVSVPLFVANTNRRHSLLIAGSNEFLQGRLDEPQSVRGVGEALPLTGHVAQLCGCAYDAVESRCDIVGWSIRLPRKRDPMEYPLVGHEFN